MLSALLQEQNRKVGQKLGIATACMVTFPLAVFYLGMYLCSSKQHPENWAGGMAIVTVNLVVAGYVTCAFAEDNDDDTTSLARATTPKAFKERTD